MSNPAVHSPAVSARLAHLGFVGAFTDADAQAQGCTLVTTEHGAQDAADHIALALLLDPAGVVKGARFTTKATGDLLATYDVMCELAVGKPLVEAAAISPVAVDAFLRQGATTPAIPLALEADQPFYVLRKAAERAKPTTVLATKANAAAEREFAACGLFEKVKRIELALDQHVRPALASDGGGLDLVDLQGNLLYVQYHGACGSCSSSVGGTLQFIQDSLNNNLGTRLTVQVTSIEETPSFV